MPSSLEHRSAIGVGIVVALGVADVTGVFAPQAFEGTGPPAWVTVSAAVLGGIALVGAVVVALVGARTINLAARATAVAGRVLATLVVVPSSFATGLTLPAVLWSVVVVALTVVAVTLILTGAREQVAAR